MRCLTASNKNFRNCFILENEASYFKSLKELVVDTSAQQVNFEVSGELLLDTNEPANFKGANKVMMDVANLPPCLKTRQNAGVFAVFAVLHCPGCSYKAVHPSPPLLVWLPGSAPLLDCWPALVGASPGKDLSCLTEIFPMHSISQSWTPGNPFPVFFAIILGNFLVFYFLSLLLPS